MMLIARDTDGMYMTNREHGNDVLESGRGTNYSKWEVKLNGATHGGRYRLRIAVNYTQR